MLDLVGFGFCIVLDLDFTMLDFHCVGFCKNVILFGVNNSSSAHADNRKKDHWIFGRGPTDGLDDTTIITEAKYSINFTEQENKFCFKSTLQWKQRFFIC